jgi:hypothetical protein
MNLKFSMHFTFLALSSFLSLICQEIYITFLNHIVAYDFRSVIGHLLVDHITS